MCEPIHPWVAAVEEVEAAISLVLGARTILVSVLPLAATPSAHLFQATNDGLCACRSVHFPFDVYRPPIDKKTSKMTLPLCTRACGAFFLTDTSNLQGACAHI